MAIRWDLVSLTLFILGSAYGLIAWWLRRTEQEIRTSVVDVFLVKLELRVPKLVQRGRFYIFTGADGVDYALLPIGSEEGRFVTARKAERWMEEFSAWFSQGFAWVIVTNEGVDPQVQDFLLEHGVGIFSIGNEKDLTETLLEVLLD